ncbi:Rz-like lysis system protein LysB [Serratia fonticola]|uniref:Rz-like lysis system protein LysB n=1 Tax=Serratia fonticola TaxID=47917 RepID=UPI0027FD8DD2|nr:Rz-like lysis system protein LysB [Serratia fonticola]MDQ7210924.1 Rz-like lysis system protein LysB [Serratia fonticola]HBE9080977.1 LysB family phage lysis regulatory protein [Serratia fonticola]HBE9091503.1 LysB family phage lysis regulatory protein [Serratia fonticola]HBE9153997.1 LysB family phage lysis regulatory protein [Serratia fonticola]
MSSRTALLSVLMLLTLIGLLKWRVVSLGTSLADAQQQNSTLTAAVNNRDTVITTLQREAGQQTEAEQQLRNTLAGAQRLALRREQQLQRALNENQALREWFSRALPADVIRLHQRPAFTGTGDYLRWLSDGQSMSDPGQPADH